MLEQKKYVINEQVWKTFVNTYKVSDKQQKQFKQFIDLLLQENKKYNLTAIVSIKDIILDHLYDHNHKLLIRHYCILHRLAFYFALFFDFFIFI